jgi:hypothetical protein
MRCQVMQHAEPHSSVMFDRLRTAQAGSGGQKFGQKFRPIRERWAGTAAAILPAMLPRSSRNQARSASHDTRHLPSPARLLRLVQFGAPAPIATEAGDLWGEPRLLFATLRPGESFAIAA